MTTPVRVRFAPSPTGHLHIGGGRTALFNFLFAKHHQGVFILRIEDTDRERSTDESTQGILEGMQWLGLNWDEGPFYQSQRMDKYKTAVDAMLAKGQAYRCYCTTEELDAMREQAMAKGEKPRYSGKCRDLKAPPAGKESTAPCIRFRSPDTGRVEFTDLVSGTVGFDCAELDDLVVLRSDGSPTYNLCVVIDDIDMNISHVVRGDDHLNNTPRQILLYRALGKEPPSFAHLPMILGPDKKKLSKRHGVPPILVYRDMGYLPEAVANYLVRLGWSHGDQEVFSQKELIEFFDFDHVGVSPSALNVDKLNWLNGEYLKKASPEALWPHVKRFLDAKGIDIKLDAAACHRIVGLLKERSKTLVEIADHCVPYLVEEVTYVDADVAKFLNAEAKPLLDDLLGQLPAVSSWTADALKPLFEGVAAKHNVKFVKLAQPVRVSLTGSSISPGIYDVLELLGKERSMKRLTAGRGKI